MAEMRFVLFCSFLGCVATAQQLRVTSADNKSIKLQWTGSATEWTVERKSGNTPFQKAGTATAATYEDNKIEPYRIYRYRLSAAGEEPSNEVVARPPARGRSSRRSRPENGRAGAIRLQ
jgi:hypothetical protein